jgi:hypothetical protein
MYRGKYLARGLLMGFAFGAAMSVALDDVSVGISLGAAAFIVFGRLGASRC